MSAEYVYKKFVWDKHIIFRIYYAGELRIGGFSKNLKSSKSPWFKIILLLMNYSWDQSSIVVDTNKLLLSNLSNQLLVLDFGTQMLWAQSWMEGIFQCRFLFVVEKKSLKKDLDMAWKIAKSKQQLVRYVGYVKKYHLVAQGFFHTLEFFLTKKLK